MYMKSELLNIPVTYNPIVFLYERDGISIQIPTQKFLLAIPISYSELFKYQCSYFMLLFQSIGAGAPYSYPIVHLLIHFVISSKLLYCLTSIIWSLFNNSWSKSRSHSILFPSLTHTPIFLNLDIYRSHLSMFSNVMCSIS